MKKAISIHALLAESDLHGVSIIVSDNHFYPRSPCGERLLLLHFRFFGFVISIHALLAESDTTLTLTAFTAPNFYPRSPCGERLLNFHKKDRQIRFLSTLSLRRATIIIVLHIVAGAISIHALLAESDISGVRHKCAIFYFYPRSPCGERHTYPIAILVSVIISIHALLAESDFRIKFLFKLLVKFLSTLSLRRATAPRVATLFGRCYFYPRSPCGERQPCIWCT